MDEGPTYVRDDGFIVIQRFMLVAYLSTDYEVCTEMEERQTGCRHYGIRPELHSTRYLSKLQHLQLLQAADIKQAAIQ